MKIRDIPGFKPKAPTVKVQKWTQEQIDDFRSWHNEVLNKYTGDVYMELLVAREQFLGMVLP